MWIKCFFPHKNDDKRGFEMEPLLLNRATKTLRRIQNSAFNSLCWSASLYQESAHLLWPNKTLFPGRKKKLLSNIFKVVPWEFFVVSSGKVAFLVLTKIAKHNIPVNKPLLDNDDQTSAFLVFCNSWSLKQTKDFEGQLVEKSLLASLPFLLFFCLCYCASEAWEKCISLMEQKKLLMYQVANLQSQVLFSSSITWRQRKALNVVGLSFTFICGDS